MKEQPIKFFSEGSCLEGTIYLPDHYESGHRYPTIIPNSGFKGFNRFYPRLFAQAFTAYGFVCLGFDYRGFAGSGGEPGRVILDEQVQDIRNAVSYAQSRSEVDPERIGILGWGMGASNVIRVGAYDHRVRAIAALNGFYVGARWLKAVHTYTRWQEILNEVASDRVRRVTTGTSRHIPAFTHYPLDPLTDQHVNVELAHLPTFEDEVTVEMTESIIEMDAERVVGTIAPRPVFIAHGVHNLLHPLEEAQSLYESAHHPKEFFEIQGSHNDFMYLDHPEFQRLVARLNDFFSQAL